MKYVYCIADPKNKPKSKGSYTENRFKTLCKIGVAKNPRHRFSSIRRTCGIDRLDVVKLVKHPRPFKLESYLHDCFRQFRSQHPGHKPGREWFSLPLRVLWQIDEEGYEQALETT